jgi:hypothetical protein
MQPMPYMMVPQGDDSTGMILAVVGLGVLGAGVAYYMLSQKDSDSDSTDADKASDTKTEKQAPSFVKDVADKWWDGGASGEYTCPTAKGVNVTGDSGNYKNYCIFDNEEDAKAYCLSDSGCKGYVTAGGSKFQLTKNPIEHSVNGKLYRKV